MGRKTKLQTKENEMRNRSHGQFGREIDPHTLNALSANGDPGRFGRMFADLEPLIVPDGPLEVLANAMKNNPGAGIGGDNQDIPAGYTYLGQFVDHDITLDTTPLTQMNVDPNAIKNFRTPALDLDSVYGDGPSISPHMYQRQTQPEYATTNKLLIGMATASSDAENGQIPNLPNDLPRNQFGRALIGDERNDENLLVAQTHLAFLKFHNKVIDFLTTNSPGLQGQDQFDEARRIVTWHYQWIVLFDWVDRLTEPGTVAAIKHQGRKYYRFPEKPFIPAEFAAAAYRLGHSMVRDEYDFNRVFNPGPTKLARGTLDLMFKFTGKSGRIVGELVKESGFQQPSNFPNAHSALPSNWVIDWRRFFEISGQSAPNGVNLSRKIDPYLATTLHTLPGFTGRFANLAFRNLKRGVNLDLPSGQSIADHLKVEKLKSSDIARGPDGAVAKSHGLHKKTPLWYYILKEADVMHGGLRLGPVGSTIVAETFLGLVHGDHKSFLWQRENWQPELPSDQPGHFTMADMLAFIGDVNPVG